MERPSVYAHGNYRSFLSLYTEYLRKKGSYSTRTFAKLAGFSSHTFLGQVIRGKKNLSKASSKRVAKALGMRDAEQRYFVLLVQFNQAKDLEEQNELYEELRDYARSALVEVHTLQKYHLYSEWYHVPILVSIGSEWKSVDPKKIASALGLRDYQVVNSLEMLVDLGLLEYKSGQYRSQDVGIETPKEVEGFFVRNFHKSMTELALEKIISLPKEERELEGVTLALSGENLQAVKKKIQDFSVELLKSYSDDRNSQGVYHINLQLIPVLIEKESGGGE